MEYWNVGMMGKANTRSGGPRFRLRASDYGGQVVVAGRDRARPSSGCFFQPFRRSLGVGGYSNIPAFQYSFEPARLTTGECAR